MNKTYLLDTNIISYLADSSSQHKDKIKKKLLSLSNHDNVSVSVITLYELSYGLQTYNDTQESKNVFESGIKFIKDYLDIYPLGVEEVDIFGKLKANYRRSTGITQQANKKNDLDFLIVATAINHDVVLVSNDAIFKTIADIEPNLKYENWLG